MPSRHDRGSVLAADLLLASILVLVVAAATSAFGLLAAATQDAHEASRIAAITAARTGDAELGRATASGARTDLRLEVTVDSDRAIAVGRLQVAVPHALFGWLEREVVASVVVPVAPYRSNR